MLLTMERMMGIDYGKNNVGIALSDHAGHYAFPKTIFPNDDSLLENIASLAQTEQVGTIILGDTENPAGGKNSITHRTIIFKAALEVRTGLRVELVDEAYTSAEARRAFEGQEARRSNNNPAVDSAAAALILQTHLDTRRK